MPNQPHATMPRRTAATFAPQVPKEARTKTGNGMPYFAPTCEFRSNGTVTIALPRITTKIEVAGSKPKTSPMFARLHDGMTTQQPTQNARNEYRPQLRNRAGVGARSLLYSWDLGSSPESSCLPSAVTTTDAAMVPSPIDHANTPRSLGRSPPSRSGLRRDASSGRKRRSLCLAWRGGRSTMTPSARVRAAGAGGCT